MKAYLIISIAILLLYSCNSDDDNEKVSINFSQELPSTYRLVKLTTNTKRSPPELPYEESYQFLTDGTVIKSRAENSSEAVINGTFTVTTDDGIQIITLQFEENSITTSCTSGLQEELIVVSDENLLNRVDSCDRLNYVYLRGN
jgi:hypothetical protein